MMERDRLTRGFYAGLGATVLQNGWSFLAYALGLTTLRMADWAAIVILGRSGPFTTAETMLGLSGHLIWGGLLGIVFVYLIPYVKHRHLTLKGLLYGWSIWFFIYGLTLLFKVEPTLNLPLMTPISDFVGATIYGLVIAWGANRLVEKELS